MSTECCWNINVDPSALFSLTIYAIKRRLVLSFKDGDEAQSFVFVSFSFSLRSALFGTASCVFCYKPDEHDATEAFVHLAEVSVQEPAALKCSRLCQMDGHLLGIDPKSSSIWNNPDVTCGFSHAGGDLLVDCRQAAHEVNTPHLLPAWSSLRGKNTSAGERDVKCDTKPHWCSTTCRSSKNDRNHIALNVVCTSCSKHLCSDIF